MTAYAGACHCGGVRFRIEAEIRELTVCDCSLCTRRNAVMAAVPLAALEVTRGEDLLQIYEWNTHQAKHRFCRRCGIYVFHRKRSEPDHYGVNVFCLEGFDPAGVPVRRFQGSQMSAVDPGDDAGAEA